MMQSNDSPSSSGKFNNIVSTPYEHDNVTNTSSCTSSNTSIYRLSSKSNGIDRQSQRFDDVCVNDSNAASPKITAYYFLVLNGLKSEDCSDSSVLRQIKVTSKSTVSSPVSSNWSKESVDHNRMQPNGAMGTIVTWDETPLKLLIPEDDLEDFIKVEVYSKGLLGRCVLLGEGSFCPRSEMLLPDSLPIWISVGLFKNDPIRRTSTPRGKMSLLGSLERSLDRIDGSYGSAQKLPRTLSMTSAAFVSLFSSSKKPSDSSSNNGNDDDGDLNRDSISRLSSSSSSLSPIQAASESFQKSPLSRIQSLKIPLNVMTRLFRKESMSPDAKATIASNMDAIASNSTVLPSLQGDCNDEQVIDNTIVSTAPDVDSPSVDSGKGVVLLKSPSFLVREARTPLVEPSTSTVSTTVPPPPPRSNSFRKVSILSDADDDDASSTRSSESSLKPPTSAYIDPYMYMKQQQQDQYQQQIQQQLVYLEQQLQQQQEVQPTSSYATNSDTDDDSHYEDTRSGVAWEDRIGVYSKLQQQGVSDDVIEELMIDNGFPMELVDKYFNDKRINTSSATLPQQPPAAPLVSSFSSAPTAGHVNIDHYASVKSTEQQLKAEALSSTHVEATLGTQGDGRTQHLEREIAKLKSQLSDNVRRSRQDRSAQLDFARSEVAHLSVKLARRKSHKLGDGSVPCDENTLGNSIISSDGYYEEDVDSIMKKYIEVSHMLEQTRSELVDVKATLSTSPTPRNMYRQSDKSAANTNADNDGYDSSNAALSLSDLIDKRCTSDAPETPLLFDQPRRDNILGEVAAIKAQLLAGELEKELLLTQFYNRINNVKQMLLYVMNDAIPTKYNTVDKNHVNCEYKRIEKLHMITANTLHDDEVLVTEYPAFHLTLSSFPDKDSNRLTRVHGVCARFDAIEIELQPYLATNYISKSNAAATTYSVDSIADVGSARDDAVSDLTTICSEIKSLASTVREIRAILNSQHYSTTMIDQCCKASDLTSITLNYFFELPSAVDGICIGALLLRIQSLQLIQHIYSTWHLYLLDINTNTYRDSSDFDADQVSFDEPYGLRRIGFTLKQIKSCNVFAYDDLLSSSFSANDLRLMGIKLEDMCRQGYSVEECYAAGYTSIQLRQGGYDDSNVIKSGIFDAALLKAAGFDVESFSLQMIYNSTQGKYWRNKDNWFCQARNNVSFNVSKYNFDTWYGIRCNGASNIITLSLRCNYLQGPIPDAIYLLFNLITLDLDNNLLSGELPFKSIGKLSKLKDCWLTRNPLLIVPGDCKPCLKLILPKCIIRYPNQQTDR